MHIQMLSEFVVNIDGVIVDEWESEKTKSVLKYLISRRNQICLNEQIIANIWPNNDFTEKKAMTLLRGRIYNARKALEPGQKPSGKFIETCSGGYMFSTDNCNIDLNAFEHHLALAEQYFQQLNLDAAMAEFEQAIQWYKGDFLEENLYSEWTTEVRKKYQQDYFIALLGLAECKAQHTFYPEAVGLCEKALKKDPLREDVLRKAMIYSFIQGNSNKAKSMYQDFVKLLEKEFSDDHREPDPLTKKLFDQVNKDRVPEAEGYPEYREYLAPIAPFEHLPLLGRQQEYSQVLHLFNDAFQGKGALLLIGGEAGVGKSRLVRQAIQFVEKNTKNKNGPSGRYERLKGRFTALKGINSEVGTQSPYLALFEVLRHVLPKQQRNQLNLSDLNCGVLSQWIYGLESFFGKPDPPTPLAPEQERLRLFEALRQLMFDLAQQNAPMVLFLDDLHWADPSTIDFLDYLLMQIHQYPLLVIGTYRTEDVRPNSSLSGLVGRAIRGSEGQPVFHLNLNAFGKEVFEQLVEEKAPQLENRNTLIEFLHCESKGNALFLIEILNTLLVQKAISVDAFGHWITHVENLEESFKDLIPERMKNIFGHRIAQLPHSEQALLQLLSVLNQQCNQSLIDDLWTKNEVKAHGEFKTLLKNLLRSHFILEEQSSYHLAHDKFREVIYQNIELSHRQSLHHHITDTLKQSQWSSMANEGVLAYHYIQADLPKQALEHLLPAIQEAVSSYRNTEALELIESAKVQINKLSSKESSNFIKQSKFDVLVEQTRVLDILGHKEGQGELLDELLHLAQELDDPEKKTQIHLMKGRLYSDLDDYPKSLSENYKALDFAKENLILESQALHGIAVYHWNTGNFEIALDYLNQEKEILESQNDLKYLSATFSYLGKVHWWKGLYIEAEEFFQKALEIEAKEKNSHTKMTIVAEQGTMYWSQNEYSKAIDSFKEVLALASRIGDKQGEAHAFGDLGLVYWSIGQYELAENEILQSLKIYIEINNLRGQAIDSNNLGLVYLSLGNLQKAHQYHEIAFDISSKIDWEVGQGLVCGGFSQIYKLQGEPEKSLEFRLKALRIFDKAQNQWLKGSALHHLGQIYIDLEDYSQALSSLESALVIKRSLDSKEKEMLILSDRAICQVGLNQTKEAVASIEKSIQLLQEHENTPHAVQIWWQYACVLTSTDQQDKYHSSLEKAYQLLLNAIRKLEKPEYRLSFSAIPMHQNILRTYTKQQAESNAAEMAAYARLRQARWPENVICPHCDTEPAQSHSSDGAMQRHRCKECEKTFNDRTGTVFANSKIKLVKLIQGLIFIDENIAQDAGQLGQLLGIQAQNAAKLFGLLTDALKNDPLVRCLLDRKMV